MDGTGEAQGVPRQLPTPGPPASFPPVSEPLTSQRSGLPPPTASAPTRSASGKPCGVEVGVLVPSVLPGALRRDELCPPFQQPPMGKAKYRAPLWPEPVGTGRPGPRVLAGPSELFLGSVIDGTRVPSWTPAPRGRPPAGPAAPGPPLRRGRRPWCLSTPQDERVV